MTATCIVINLFCRGFFPCPLLAMTMRQNRIDMTVGKNDDKNTVPAEIRENYIQNIKNYHETDKFIYFNFAYRTFVYFILISKATGQSYIQSLSPAANEKQFRLFEAKSIYKDQLVALIEVSWLKMDLERSHQSFYQMDFLKGNSENLRTPISPFKRPFTISLWIWTQPVHDETTRKE